MYDKNNIKKILSIAGSDCSGCSGIQADLKTFASHGVFGMAVITSVVAENTFRITDYQDIRSDIIEKQIDDVFEDITPDAVKIGMLSCRDAMLSVAKKLKKWKPKNIVVDPVMYAKNGEFLIKEPDINTMISKIFPLADLVTPNILEAEKISGMEIKNLDDIKKAAKIIAKNNCRSVIIKGACDKNDAVDVLLDNGKLYEYRAPYINTNLTNGAGCTFSSSVASNLALGIPLIKALKKTKEYINIAIVNAPKICKGNGPLNHFYEIYKNFSINDNN